MQIDLLETLEVEKRMKYQLLSLRVQLRWTQRKLAEKALISETAYLDIEKKRVDPRDITKQGIVEALNEERKRRNPDTEALTLEDIEWT